MGCKVVRIGDVAVFRKESVKPKAGVIYHCYSFPAFDNACTPEVMDGSKILSSKFRFVAGDILVNKLNMRFKRIWPIGDQLAPNSVCSTEFIPLTPNENVDRNFLLYVLLSDSFTRKLSGMRTGTSGSHQRVKVDWILDYEFMLPDFTTQCKIGDILATIDAKIALNGRINDYLEELCDAIYQDFVNSNDESWRRGTLNELLDIKYGKDHKKLADGPYPVYGSGGYMRSVEKPLANGESVLIPRKGSLNNVMYVNEEFWTVDTMFFTVPRVPGAAKYAFQYIKKLDLESMNSGSAVPSMTTAILNALELPIPDHEALRELDKRLQPMYKLKAANKTEIEQLSALRDAILPKLMSGEIDVSNLDLTQLNNHLCDCLYVS